MASFSVGVTSNIHRTCPGNVFMWPDDNRIVAARRAIRDIASLLHPLEQPIARSAMSPNESWSAPVGVIRAEILCRGHGRPGSGRLA
jgi:hypothetical protein